VVEDEGRDVAGMGIAIADEPAALRGFIDGGLEDPEALLGAAEGQHRFGRNPTTLIS